MTTSALRRPGSLLQITAAQVWAYEDLDDILYPYGTGVQLNKGDLVVVLSQTVRALPGETRPVISILTSSGPMWVLSYQLIDQYQELGERGKV